MGSGGSKNKEVSSNQTKTKEATQKQKEQYDRE